MGMVTAGNPNKGVNAVEGSEEADAVSREGDAMGGLPALAEVGFSVLCATNLSRRVDKTTSCCFREFRSSDGEVRDELDWPLSEWRTALQTHLLQR